MNISLPPLPHGRQNTPSSPPINTTDTLQITVSYKTRTIALRVNDGPIIADLLPDIARRLGILDPSIVYGGYRLLTSDGDPLSPAKTLREQHVPNHSTLTLEPGASSDTDIIYDDVVEAVGASVQHVYRPWTSDHTTFTSLVIGLGMLVISAGWIALSPASIWASVLAFGFSAILLALTAALCGKNLLVQSTAIGLIASIFTAIGGYQLVNLLAGKQPLHALPLLGASLGLAAAGILMSLAASKTRPYSYIPILIGAICAIPSVLSTLMPQQMGHIWILTSAVTALTASALPWMCLSFARISVDSPHSESEIFALPNDIDYQDIKRRYIAGSTMLFIGRICVAALLLIAAPLLNTLDTPLGSALCLAAFLGMLLDSRQIYTFREMCVTVGAAGIGIIVTGSLSVQTHQEFNIPLILLMLACAFATILFTYVLRKHTLFATRVADAAETICIMLILPLAYLAITL